MESKDDTAMQRLLVESLKRGKKIGLRGELIDAARHLYLLTEKVLGEMRGKAAAVSDDEDEAIYEVNEEDRQLLGRDLAANSAYPNQTAPWLICIYTICLWQFYLFSAL